MIQQPQSLCYGLAVKTMLCSGVVKFLNQMKQLQQQQQQQQQQQHFNYAY